MAQGDAQRLEQVASQVLRFYERAFPMLASLFAEPALLARHRHRQGLAAVGAGPHRPNQLLAAYLRAERELGRIDASVDPEAAAMLLGACFQRAFLSAFSGQPILVRLRWHQPTKDYMARRLKQGKSKKEITRCLKRYVAREVFAALNQTSHDTPTPAA